MMTGCIFGHNEASFREKIEARGKTKEELRQRGIVLGTANEVKEQLYQLEDAGLQRVMLQWLDLDDLAGLEALAKAVL